MRTNESIHEEEDKEEIGKKRRREEKKEDFEFSTEWLLSSLWRLNKE